MGVLATEVSCLACHAMQGYAVGDIRGGISVSFSVQSVEKELRRNVIIIIASAVQISCGILGAVFHFASRLRKVLDTVRSDLKRAAICEPG
jgi:hypothetical protein